MPTGILTPVKDGVQQAPSASAPQAAPDCRMASHESVLLKGLRESMAYPFLSRSHLFGEESGNSHRIALSTSTSQTFSVKLCDYKSIKQSSVKM